MLHRLGIGSLFAVFATLWAASVFLTYPHCEMDGASVVWCEFIAVVVGFSDVVVTLVVVLLFLREKGAAKCLDACFKVRTRARAVSMSVGQGITNLFDRVHGPEAVRARQQTRIRRNTVDVDDGSVEHRDKSLGGHRIGADHKRREIRRDGARDGARSGSSKEAKIRAVHDRGRRDFLRGRGHGRERVGLALGRRGGGCIVLNTHDAYCAEVDIIIFTFLPGTMLPLSLGKSSSLWNQLQRLDTGQ